MSCMRTEAGRAGGDKARGEGGGREKEWEAEQGREAERRKSLQADDIGKQHSESHVEGAIRVVDTM